MNKKTIITALLALVWVAGQGQIPSDLPEHVKNHQMDMEAPLPEPSFEMDSTTVRVHILNWEAGKTLTKMVCLGVGSFFPYIADNYTGFTDDNGLAIVRFPQRGTSMVELSVGDGFSKHFYTWPGETADVYVDVERMTKASLSYRKWKMQPKDYGFGQTDTLTAEQKNRQVVTEEYGFDQQPALWFEGRYGDLNTALHRYVPFIDGYGWDMSFERQLTLNRPLAPTYADEMLAWHDHLKELIQADTRLPLCAKQFCSLAIDIQAENMLWGNAQMLDTIAARKDGVSPSKYVEERPLSEQQIAQFRSLGTNTNYRAYFRSLDLSHISIQKFWDAISGDNPCDYIHDMRIVQGHPRHIELYGSLPEGAMKGVRMPYFHKLCQQLEAAQEGIEHEVYSDVIEDLQRRYRGKVVLIDFWATWCHGCIVAMNAMEPEKDTKFNHPDLAFVYITDHTSPADRWQDYRNRIRGEHLRVNEQQMDALQRRFHITVWPTYILMDRRGRLRELPHNHLEDEILKELGNKNK